MVKLSLSLFLLKSRLPSDARVQQEGGSEETVNLDQGGRPLKKTRLANRLKGSDARSH